jgi:hypothetical protein
LPPGAKSINKTFFCRQGPNQLIKHFFAEGKQHLPSHQNASIRKTQIAGIGVNDVINNFDIKVVSTGHESFCKIQICVTGS